MKHWFMLAALVAGQAMAQSADISGAQLLSGEADARLQALAREAAAADRKLVISAPEYWHEMILEQVRRGGGDGVQVEVRDSFAEAVMVRSDALAAEAPVDEPPAPAAPAAVAQPAPAPVPAPRPATPAVASSPTPQPAAPAPVRPAAPAPAPAPAATPTPRPAAPVAATPQATPVPPTAPASAAATPRPATPSPAPAPRPTQSPVAAEGTPAPAAVSDSPAAVAAAERPAATTGSAAAEAAAIKRRLEESLNEGQPITRTLIQTALEPNDVLYARGEVIAVQRRDSLRSQFYWLEGGIELMRVELRETGPNRYVVTAPIRNVDSPRLRTVRAEERDLFTAAEPGRHAQERAALERRYNGGNRIDGVLAPTQINQRDIVYVGDDLAVVVRVTAMDLERFFLVGRINLGRSELLKDGNNKYRVLRDIRQ